MPWDPLILGPLLGGYLYVAWNPRLAYGANRLSRTRLFLSVATWAIILAAIAWLITRLALSWPNLEAFAAWWASHFPQPYSGVAALAFVLGAGMGAALRRAVNHSEAFRDWFLKDYLDRWIDEHGNEMERFFRDMSRQGTPVQITLKSRKVYVGQVLYTPAEHPHAGSHITVNLYASGYRQESDLTLCLTSRYHMLLGQLRQLLDRIEHLDEEIRSRMSAAGSLAERRRLRYQTTRLARCYLSIWNQIEGMIVVVPFDEITAAMPFDERVFSQMSGTDQSGAVIKTG